MIAATLALVSTFSAPALPQEASGLFDHIDACEAGRATLKSLGDHLAPPRHRMEVTMEIHSTSLQHGPRPDAHRVRDLRQQVRIFAVDSGAGEDVAWRIDVERSDLARPGAAPGRLRVHDQSAIEDHSDGPGPALLGGAALHEQITQRAAFPAALCHYLRVAGRVLDCEEVSDGAQRILLELEGGRVLVRTISVDYAVDESTVRVPGLIGVDWMTHSELLGDVVHSLTYGDAPSPAPGVVGNWSITGPLGTGDQVQITKVVLDSAVPPFPGGAIPDFEATVEARRAAAESPSIEILDLGQGSYELLYGAEAARSLAVDLGPGWAVLEAPVSSAAGLAIIQRLEEEKPGHPFLYVCASHHHPHYIGGFRPFIHRGATVVCPAGVLDYVEHVVTRSRTLEPDELAGDPKTPRLIGVEPGERWAPPEAEDRLILAEANGHSAHTESFLLFFLPQDRIAFGGDLLWLNTEGSRRGPNPRTIGLAKILKDSEDLGAYEFMTSWPAGGEPIRGKVWRDRVPVAEILADR